MWIVACKQAQEKSNIVEEQVQPQLLHFYQSLHEYMMSNVSCTAAFSIRMTNSFNR
jgi:hypothetical protein